MIYTLGLVSHGHRSLNDVLAEIASSPPMAELQNSGVLDLREVRIDDRVTFEQMTEWLGEEPTECVLLSLDDKEPDEDLYMRARRGLVSVATDIASRLGATAVMAHESGRAVLERRQGSYLLYSWFPECTDDVVLAHLRDPYRFTDARGMLP